MRKILIALGLIVGPMVAVAARTADRSPPAQNYTIQSGDSLYTIAKKFGVSIETLRTLNHLGEKDLLHPGEKLILPASASTKEGPAHRKRAPKSAKKSGAKKVSGKQGGGGEIYRVRPGDTLSDIAHKRGVSVKAILKANQMKPDALIKVGQSLTIPVSEKSAEPKRRNTRNSPEKTSRKARSAQKPAKATKGAKGIHVVQYGDTLFSIARKYHTPLKDLMRLNGIQPTDVIHPGQELKIPGNSYRSTRKNAKKKRTTTRTASKTKPKSVEPVVYVVRHGDTLWEIARKHKVSITQIRHLNKMKRRDVIRTGMKLLIKEGSGRKTSTTRLAKPQKKKAVKKIEKRYTVKQGDTLWEIAKRHHTSVSELRRLNGMKRGDVIHTGMKLTVGYEKVPPTRLAKKTKKKNSKKATAKRGSRKGKTRMASGKKRKKSSSRRKKSADRRINRALAALNGKHHGGGRSRGGDYNVIRTAKKFLGRRYVWGAEGPSCFDCSGFTQYVMRKSKGVKIPRVSRKQAYYGKYVTRSQLRPGDLIFFDTSRRRRGYVNHVGIYIGNGKFIHASSARHRVVITSLNSPFYRARFKWGRRVN